MITNLREFTEYCKKDYKDRGLEFAENPVESALRKSARHNNPIVPDYADMLPWSLYDRLTVAAGASTSAEHDYFVVPIGGAKTKADTNLRQVSRLPDPQHFFVRAMRIIPEVDMWHADLTLIWKNYWVELVIGEKTYMEGPLGLFPGGSGFQNTFAAGSITALQFSLISHGQPTPLAINDYGDKGFSILQGQTFMVKLLGTAQTMTAAGAAGQPGGTGMNIRVVLEGILSRAVQ